MTPILYAAFAAACFLFAALADWLVQRWITCHVRIRRTAAEQYVRELAEHFDPEWEREWQEVAAQLADDGEILLAFERHHLGRVYLLPLERRVAP